MASVVVVVSELFFIEVLSVFKIVGSYTTSKIHFYKADL